MNIRTIWSPSTSGMTRSCRITVGSWHALRGFHADSGTDDRVFAQHRLHHHAKRARVVHDQYTDFRMRHVWWTNRLYEQGKM
ncbi:MAG: hypothetical protein DWH73_04290 [Planctomycetota bacterium]|nr:MAG: hypothetical protein DWH73_04290 [Planctomycetota bacterium]